MFLYLILFSLIIVFLIKFIPDKYITRKEHFYFAVASVLWSIVISYFMVYHSSPSTRVVTGFVTGKEIINVKVQEKGCNIKQNCYVDGKMYLVDSTVGQVQIPIVDDYGMAIPPRFDSVDLGESFSTEMKYIDFFEMSKKIDFSNVSDNIYMNKIPDYPQIINYYKFNGMIIVGSIKKNFLNLNKELSKEMIKWYPKYDLNIIVFLLSDNYDASYFEALESKWNGGKRNDVVIVVQMDTKSDVNWAKVMARSQSDDFKNSIAFELENIKDINTEKLINVIDKNLKEKYTKIKVSENDNEFSFLLNPLITPADQVLYAIMSLVGLLLMTIALYKYDLHEKSEANRR